MAAQLRGMEQVRGFMSSSTLFLIADFPFALFFITVVALIGGVVALVLVLTLPLSVAIAFGLARMIRTGTDRAQVSGNRKNGMLVESLDAAESIKAGRGGWFMLGRWNRLIREVHHYEDPVKQSSAVAGTIFGTMQQLSYVAIMAVGAIEVGSGHMTSGGLLACSIISGRVTGPLVGMLPGLIVQWGYARSSLKALDGILKLPLDRTSNEASLRPGSLNGPMVVENIRFAYPGAREGLDVPRLQFNPGERIAIIGGVGSGKTTLLRILAGIFHPQAGSARIGGLDIGQIADDILRQHLGYQPQDYRLINGTLRDNLMLGIAKPTDDDVMEAAKKTGLINLISGHPLGLDLPIQEGGRGLSGGQRSLVGMTRMILANPTVWLLDEPTANLDQNSEVAVLGALEAALGPQQTLVIVTHRLQLLARVQRVILMGGGKILLDGPTAEVIQRLQGKPQPPKVVTPVTATVGR
jgi:ATP-binding cassette subfamily C protein LapB